MDFVRGNLTHMDTLSCHFFYLFIIKGAMALDGNLLFNQCYCAAQILTIYPQLRV